MLSNLANLFRYRGLIQSLVARELKARYRGSALGFVWSARALGKSMTPYPRPRETGELVEKGPYRFVRHPIYAAGLLFFLGVGLSSSVPATLGALALGTLWWRKAAVEEAHLVAQFPEYEDYRRRVRRL